MASRGSVWVLELRVQGFGVHAGFGFGVHRALGLGFWGSEFGFKSLGLQGWA